MSVAGCKGTSASIYVYRSGWQEGQISFNPLITKNLFCDTTRGGMDELAEILAQPQCLLIICFHYFLDKNENLSYNIIYNKLNNIQFRV